MKKLRDILLAFSFMAGCCLAVHAAGTTDLEDLSTGPNEGNTVWKVSANGGLQQGAPSGSSNLNTAANSAIGFTVISSTPMVQGDVVIVGASTAVNPNQINGLLPTTNNATTLLGVADTAASSGTAVTIDYAGVAVVLGSGTITVGDILVSTGSPSGYAQTNNSASAGAIIGTALNSGTVNSPGLIRVLLHH